ncbi:hypothetical protein [Okeania hirsuta]|nr:hypothetical protein [Okeania hirsuta]
MVEVRELVEDEVLAVRVVRLALEVDWWLRFGSWWLRFGLMEDEVRVDGG